MITEMKISEHGRGTVMGKMADYKYSMSRSAMEKVRGNGRSV